MQSLIEQLFYQLSGEYSVTRIIDNEGVGEGVARFTADDNNFLWYQEELKVKYRHYAQTLTASANYKYVLQQGHILKYFNKKDNKQLFYQLNFHDAVPEERHAKHYCADRNGGVFRCCKPGLCCHTSEWHPGARGMDSSLRRNDNGGRNDNGHSNNTGGGSDGNYGGDSGYWNNILRFHNSTQHQSAKAEHMDYIAAQGTHLCNLDLYQAHYVFYNGNHFSLDYKILGPNKDFTITTEFARLC